MVALGLRLLLVLCCAAFAAPGRAATVTAAPKSASPGADFVASSSGLTAGTNYRLELHRIGIGGGTYSLGTFNATAATAARLVRVPTAATLGSYDLRLVDATRGGVIEDTHPFIVRAGLQVTLQPASAEPGRSVRVSVSGLRAGNLTLAFAGERVLGSVAVGEGSWSGKFIVPRDRPPSVPASTTVGATNLVGRTVASTGSVAFNVLAPSGTPRFRATTLQAPPPTVTEGGRLAFRGRLARPDDQGTTGRTSFFWRPNDGSRIVPIDGGVTTAADGTYTLANGRAPSFYMDGVPRSGSGEIVAVISDDDPDADTPRDSSVDTDLEVVAEPERPAPPNISFRIRVLGQQSDVQPAVPVPSAYLDVQGDLDAGFLDPASAPPPSNGALMSQQNQFTRGTVEVFDAMGVAPYEYGCELNFARKFTDANGEATFLFDPEAVQRAQMLGVMKDLGEIRTQAVGVPSPLEDIWQPGDVVHDYHDAFQGAGRRKGGSEEFLDPLYLVLRIQAGQRGYGEAGLGSEGVLQDVWLYQPTFITIVFDLATGDMDAFGFGNPTISGQTVTVRLPRLPDASAGVAPFDLRIDGVQGGQPGPGIAEFKGMHSFPNPPAAWPPIVRNQGRPMRFAWESAFGQIGAARLTVRMPSGAEVTSSFSEVGPSACHLSGATDWVAPLPDMTHWPVSDTSVPYCRVAQIEIDLLGGRPDAGRQFRICTAAPPPELRNGKVNVTAIDALTGEYEGTLALPNRSLTESDSNMQEWHVPPLRSNSGNDGTYYFATTVEGYARRHLNASIEHELANEDTDSTGQDEGMFGFDEDGQPIREVVMDTGVIPLFRYPWGWSPIAGAVFGADFWLSSTLAFYGTMGTGDAFMDATIDPTLNGGLDVFFDLDVLFGLVSASVSAQPQLGLSMKEKIGRGGLPGDQNGLCFGFDVDVAMEICAVLCAEDEFNLFRAREPNGCSVSMQKGLPSGAEDQAAPSLAPSALAVDGEANTIVLEPDAAGQLVAYHMEGTEIADTRTVASNAWSIQHVDVEYLERNQALAVWSQSSLTRAQLLTLMGAPGAVRNSADDVARAQVLRWSWFDGNSWSAPAAVPGAQGGSGKPKLALGRCTTFSCVRVGDSLAYLVWEYDAANNIAAPDLEVWGAQFRPGTGFSGTARISGSGSTSDMHPDVAWLGATPLVAWISTPLPHYQPSTQRNLKYRVIDDPDGGRFGNAVRTSSLPLRAGWPSLARLDANSAILAFTVAQDASVVGNRNALHAAQIDCSGDTCSFQSTEVRDPNGRQYRVERPIVAIDEAGEALVSFRGLAFGPDANGQHGRRADAVGMLTGTGEHLAVRIPSFSTSITQTPPQGLSNDGLQHFRPDFVFDPALGGFLAISRRADAAITKHAVFEAARSIVGDRFAAAGGAKALGDTGLHLTSLSAAPDFRVESFTMTAPYVEAGQSASFQVRIRNVGADYDPQVHGSARVHVAWDAPPGSGIAAGLSPVALLALTSGSAVTLTRNAVAPAGHMADERRTLFVEVKVAAGQDDAIGADNVASLTLGAMPVPQELSSETMTNSPVVALDWQDPADPRVAGYRVYKRAENGDFVPYGSSDVSGYADLFAGFRDTEFYRVTSYSARGIESEPSHAVMAKPLEEAQLFRDSFESAP